MNSFFEKMFKIGYIVYELISDDCDDITITAMHKGRKYSGFISRESIEDNVLIDNAMELYKMLYEDFERLVKEEDTEYMDILHKEDNITICFEASYRNKSDYLEIVLEDEEITFRKDTKAKLDNLNWRTQVTKQITADIDITTKNIENRLEGLCILLMEIVIILLVVIIKLGTL